MSHAKRLFRFLFRGFTRKKDISGDLSDTRLDRCLNVVDLTALGVGSTLGAGIYVVAGQVAKTVAGPGVIISFLIAAIASVFAGLCYAEFGARVPKTGSAYVYSYVSVGEFMAFVIGWNLILEYAIGTASVARAWTANFDALINNAISNYMLEHLPMHVPGLAEFPDFFAVALILLLTVTVSVGVKESTGFNNIFTLINIMVIFYVVICGSFHLNIANWEIDPNKYKNKTEVGQGGFFPFGISGVLSGASTCFFAFVGFDAIATAGEEVKNPQRNIPISIVACLTICAVGYFSISAILTLMSPYFLLDENAPLPFVFNEVGWTVAQYFIAVGSLCGLSTSLFGALFPLPRVVYAMATDGLVFRFLSKIYARTRTPLVACMISGFLCAVMACLFDISELVNMMSIGTLLAYILVAASVLLLRGTYIDRINDTTDLLHRPPLFENDNRSGEEAPVTTDEIEVPNEKYADKKEPDDSSTSGSGNVDDTITLMPQCCQEKTAKNIMRHLFVRHYRSPTPVSSFINTLSSYALLLGSFILAGLLQFEMFDNYYYIGGLCINFLINFLILVVIAFQPEDPTTMSFKVPFVPWVPAMSLFINAYLMCKLPYETWIRFAVWMAVGLIIYFGYGIRKSSEAIPRVSGLSYETI